MDRGDDEELVAVNRTIDLEVVCGNTCGGCCWMGATRFLVAPLHSCDVRLCSPLLLLKDGGGGDEYRLFFRSIVGGGVFGLFRSVLSEEVRSIPSSSSWLKAPSGKSQ